MCVGVRVKCKSVFGVHVFVSVCVKCKSVFGVHVCAYVCVWVCM